MIKFSEQLAKLKLTFLKDHIDEFVKIAEKNPSKAIKWWLDQEFEEARLKSEKRRITASRIGACLAQKDFDWGLIESPKDIRTQIENLISKDFVSLRKNINLIVLTSIRWRDLVLLVFW
jgi:hypothetical protein